MVAGFTAVVLAGGEGTRLRPLCGGACPKPLLRLATRPMIFYPLRWLYDSGFKGSVIHVVTTKAASAALQVWLEEARAQYGFNTQLHVHGDDGHADSADGLRAIAGEIQRDALVVSCDTITDMCLADLICHHRRTEAAATVVLRHIDQDEAARKVRSKERQLTEYVGLDGDDPDRITFFASSADIDDPLALKKTFLYRRPNTSLTAALGDMHVYLLSPWALGVLKQLEGIQSLKHEFLPVLVAQQWRRRQGPAADAPVGTLRQPPPDRGYICKAEDPFPEVRCPSDLGAVRAGRPPVDPTSVRAHIVGAPQLQLSASGLKGAAELKNFEFITRVAWLSQFSATTKLLAKGAEAAAKGDTSGLMSKELAQQHDECWTKSLMPRLQSKVTVSPPSIISEGFQPGAEQVVIKGSVIGRDVKIGDKTRVLQSIIMDGAEIGSECKLQGCMIGERAVVPAGTQLTDCLVGLEHEVPHPGEYKGEVLSQGGSLV
eukprot:TRINITY_DN50719_c0_g1_i1.p1 TRINITY_DN50719_c0_g1~~TRINITY_DN50719_c0_g1_i1.p1  ORF type:complete len:488 (+),score=161.71 TRINITY_DN50719_c0_g1_i1:87-1550(+)